MKFKLYSLFSSLLLYVAVILFTLGGIQIGETHKSEKLKGLSVSGNTYAGLDVDHYDIYASVGGAGSGYVPATVDGKRATAFFSFSVTLTGKSEPKTKVDIVTDGGSLHIADGNYCWVAFSNGILATPAPSDDGPLGEAELDIYGSMSVWINDFQRSDYVRHHHVVKSICPPNDYESLSNSTNVGPKSDPH